MEGRETKWIERHSRFSWYGIFSQMPQKTLTFFRFLKAFAQWEISFSLAL
jgi:hypothetical protein